MMRHALTPRPSAEPPSTLDGLAYGEEGARSGIRPVAPGGGALDDGRGAEPSGSRGAVGPFVHYIDRAGVGAFPLVGLIAVAVGAAIVLQTMMAPMPPSAELGRMMVVVIVRELAPLLTAVMIAGHAGGALVASGRRHGSGDGGEARSCLAGVSVAAMALAVHFAVACLLSAFLVSQALTLRTAGAVIEGVQQELAWFDVPLFFVKAGGLGALVAGLCWREGARMVRGGEGVEEGGLALGTSRAFVRSLLVAGCFSVSLTLMLYMLIGAPAPP